MATGRMKVFISWSGERSKQVALVWRELVKLMFDGVDPFMSQRDIGAGDRGLPVIAAELADTGFGIIVLTKENQFSQWLNYESGALSKNVEDATVRVAPSLVDFTRASDAKGPIAQFQAKLLDREGIEDILVEIAKVANADEQSVRTRFAAAWDTEYERRFSEARKTPAQASEDHRDRDDVMDEILTTVRGLARTAGVGAAQEGKRLSLPLDTLDQIRTVLASFLGSDYAGLSITLSSTDDGRPQVVVPLDGPVVHCMVPLGEALAELGASANFVASPGSAVLSGQGGLAGNAEPV